MMPFRSWIRKLVAPAITRPIVRRLAVEVLEDRLTPAYNSFAYLGSTANPFYNTSPGTNAAPVFGDLDGDGDLDVLMGQGSKFRYYRNVGTASAPAYAEQTGAANPFSALAGRSSATPALGDVDGDGDLDVIAGGENGLVAYYRNVGTATAPVYAEQTGAANPFGGVTVRDTDPFKPPGGVFGWNSAPALGDMDGDSDLDLVVGCHEGIVKYYRNVGTASAPAYAVQTGAANPFGGVRLPLNKHNAAPALGDVDGDGDLDAVLGNTDGALLYFRNAGTATAPAYTGQAVGGENPFTFSVTAFSKPALGDADGDGDLDVLLGSSINAAYYFRNDVVVPAVNYDPGAGSGFVRNGTGSYGYTTPAAGDVDGDGDLDVVMGSNDGTLRYYRNTGTATAVSYAPLAGSANPFNGIDVGTYSSPALGDLDRDGDLDLVVGGYEGQLRYYRNVGTATAPVYVQFTGSNNPFGGVNVSNKSAPALGDVDGDGDLDLVVGGSDGTLRYYRNTGTARSPAFAQQTGAANPFGGVATGSYSSPALGDVDGDGDLDLVAGAGDGTLRYYRNTGTATAPAFAQQAGVVSPFFGLDIGSFSTPTLGDLDGDGDLDTVVGGSDGTLTYFGQNRAPVLAVPVPDQTVTRAGAYSYTLPAVTFEDLDGNALTYSAAQTNGAALPAWLSFDPATRTFSGTASVSSNTVQVRVTVSDGRGGSRSDDFQLIVPLPTVTADRPRVGTYREGSLATNAGSFGSIFDPLGALTLTASLGTITRNDATGRWNWSYVIPDDSASLIPVTITVTDTAGNSVSTTFGVDAYNVAPTVTSVVVPTSISEGSVATLTATATDPGGANDPLTYSWTILRPDGTRFTLSGPSVSFIPTDSGSYSYTLVVSDDDGGSTPGTIQGGTAAPEGLVAWWRGQNNATDTQGGNNGTTTGYYNTGKVGYGFGFQGQTGVTVPDAPGLDLTSAVSVEAWIGVGFSSAGAVVSKGDGANRNYALSVTSDRALRLTYTTTGGAEVVLQTAAGVVPFQFGWAHVAGVIDPGTGTMQIYRDGELVASRATGGPLVANAASLYIGRVPGETGLNGTVDEVSVYNRALTAAEIRAVYNAAGAGKAQSFTVRNVAPTVTVAAPAAGVRSLTQTITLSATDVSPADAAAGFTYTINWGDGSPVQRVAATASNGSGVSVGHVYAANGAYTVTVTATDKNGGTSAAVTRRIMITPAAILPDPLNPGQNALFVAGTSVAERIEVGRGSDGRLQALVYTLTNGQPSGVWSRSFDGSVGRVVVYGGDGNDTIVANANLSTSAWLYGGGGNDRLTGGGGNDVLLGGDGADQLFARGGRDILIGGTGEDTLTGSASSDPLAGGDLLIAGMTAFDADEVALLGVQLEWTSARPFEQRVANLRGTGTGERANGGVFLRAVQTVFDDGAADRITGGSGWDWVFANLVDGVADTLLGLSGTDWVDELG